MSSFTLCTYTDTLEASNLTVPTRAEEVELHICNQRSRTLQKQSLETSTNLDKVTFFKVTPGDYLLYCVDHVSCFTGVYFSRTSAHIGRTSGGD